MYDLKVTLSSANMDLVDVDEFVPGVKFFYVRMKNGNTITLSTNSIRKVELKKNGTYKPVTFKKIPKSLKVSK